MELKIDYSAPAHFDLTVSHKNRDIIFRYLSTDYLGGAFVCFEPSAACCQMTIRSISGANIEIVIEEMAVQCHFLCILLLKL
jgi:hypothetical protein